MKRLGAIFLLAVFLLTVLVGCGGDSNGGGGESGGGTADKNVIFGSNLGTDALDPSYDFGSWFVVRYGIMETLFKLDENLVPQPWLAESYENVDETTWTVTIKDGITFSNGTELTGQAVVDALEYTRGKTDLVPASILDAAFTADGQVVTIKTATPSPTMLNDLADPFCAIMDVHSGTDFNSNPIGTGPFKVTSFEAKSNCKLARNETYWDGPSPLETVEIRTIMDADTLTMAMQAGEVDWAQGITAENLTLFEDTSSYTISTVATSRAFIGTLNLNNEHLSNPNFRKAILMAMDKESFCNELMSGAATPTNGMFPASLPYGDDALTGAVEYDMDGAKALLEQEGYTLEDGKLMKDGKQVTMRIVSTISRAEIPLLAEGIAAQLMELGIDAQIINSADDSRTTMSTDEFEIGLMAHVTASTGDPYATLNAYASSEGSHNYSHYNNPEVDALLEQLSAEYDSDKRAELTIQIQNILLQDNPLIFFCHLNLSMVCKANITGMVSHPTDFYQVTNLIDVE